MAGRNLEKPFEEVFFDCLWSCFREVGLSLTVSQLENFRQACTRSAVQLDKKIHQRTLVMCRRLQTNTKNAFEAVQKDMEKINKKIRTLEKRKEDNA